MKRLCRSCGGRPCAAGPCAHGVEHTAEVECRYGGWLSEREIGDTDPPRGGEREAKLYGQAFLVERVLHKHSGLDEQVIRAYVKTQEDLDRQEDLFNQ